MAILSVRPALKALCVGCFWLIFSLAYFLNWPFPQADARIAALAVTALIGISAAGWGFPLRRRLLPAELSALESLIFSLGFGFGIFGLLLFILGIFNAWTPAAAWSLIAVGCFSAIAFSSAFPTGGQKPSGGLSLSQAAPAAAMLIFLAGICSWLLIFAPITYYDSLVYHMALPAAYEKARHWVAMP